MSNKTCILDASGQPIEYVERTESGQLELFRQKVTAARKSYVSFVQSLYGMEADALTKTRSPFSTHPWVYAAAMAIATNIAQPTLRIYRETRDTEMRRQGEAAVRGIYPSHGRGRRRTAISRYLSQKSRTRATPITGVEPDHSHPLMTVLNRPNYQMTSTTLWQATSLWQTLHGSCMWVLYGKDGGRYIPGEVPSEIWPMPPHLFTPQWGSNNRLAGWTFNVPRGVGLRDYGGLIDLMPHEVITFKYIHPDPNWLWTGFAPLSATVENILLDKLAMEHNRSTLENGAAPSGVLMSPNEFESEDEKEELREDWDAKFKGARKRGRVAVLGGGLKYVSVGMSNQEMEYLGMKGNNRDEILGVLRTPKSIVSVTDDITYATQQSQDYNFWDKNLIPTIRMWEDEMDHTLLAGESDNVFAAFDLSQVDALRTGLEQAIKNARAMSASDLHVPPRIALKVAGIDEVPSYLADDTALVGGTTVQQVLDGEGNGGAAPTDLPTSTPPTADPGDAPNTNPYPDTSIYEVFSRTAASEWRKYVDELQGPAEDDFSIGWRSYLTEERDLIMQAFGQVGEQLGLRAFTILKGRANDIADRVLPDLGESRKRLKSKMLPRYEKMADKTLDFSYPEFGTLPIFDLEDELIQSALDTRENVFMMKAPKSVQKRVLSSIRQGLELGETMEQIRSRVERAFKKMIHKRRAMTIARTESSGFISFLRYELFKAGKVETLKWLTAGDEKVRDTHVVYGGADPKPFGFNYMTLSGRRGGSLKFPGDPEAPADEVISCRCLQVAWRS